MKESLSKNFRQFFIKTSKSSDIIKRKKGIVVIKRIIVAAAAFTLLSSSITLSVNADYSSESTDVSYTDISFDSEASSGEAEVKPTLQLKLKFNDQIIENMNVRIVNENNEEILNGFMGPSGLFLLDIPDDGTYIILTCPENQKGNFAIGQFIIEDGKLMAGTNVDPETMSVGLSVVEPYKFFIPAYGHSYNSYRLDYICNGLSRKSYKVKADDTGYIEIPFDSEKDNECKVFLLENGESLYIGSITQDDDFCATNYLVYVDGMIFIEDEDVEHFYHESETDTVEDEINNLINSEEDYIHPGFNEYNMTESENNTHIVADGGNDNKRILNAGSENSPATGIARSLVMFSLAAAGTLAVMSKKKKK